MKLIMENWKKFVNEQEQLELPGIPAGDPEQRTASLETAKIILRDRIESRRSDHILNLVYAAPRAVDGLSAPLPGLRDARSKIMTQLDGVNISPEIAEQVLSILKQHEGTKVLIDALQKTLFGALRTAQRLGTGEAFEIAVPGAPGLGSRARQAQISYLLRSAHEALRLSKEDDLEAEIGDLKE